MDTKSRTITFKTDLSPDGLVAALAKIKAIGGAVKLFQMAAVDERGDGMSAQILSVDRSLLIEVSARFINADVVARLDELGACSGYNHRLGRHVAGMQPGGEHNVSSKTKLAKAMRYLGAPAKIPSALRKATASTLLQISDLSDPDDPDTTHIEVIRKDEAVRVTWDVAIDGVELTTPVTATVTASVGRCSELSYKIEYDYDKSVPMQHFFDLMTDSGLTPFYGSIA